MRLILTIFLTFVVHLSLLSQQKVWEKNFSSPSRYYTLGDLALSSDSTKLLMAVTDPIGRIEINVLDTSGNILKQMWHGRTDCTSWEYRASSIIEYNGNYVVGCSADASCFLSTGAFLLILDTNLNVLQEIELPYSYRSLTDIVSTLKVDQKKLFVTYSESGNYWFCEFDTNYILKTSITRANGLYLDTRYVSYCPPKLKFNGWWGKYIIAEVNFDSQTINTIQNNSDGNLIDNNCNGNLLNLKNDLITFYSDNNSIGISTPITPLLNHDSLYSIGAQTEDIDGGVIVLVSVINGSQEYPVILKINPITGEQEFFILDNWSGSPTHLFSADYGKRIIISGDYVYTGLTLWNPSNNFKEQITLAKLKFTKLNVGIKEEKGNGKLTCFPNPSLGIFRLRSEKPITGLLKIYNITGELKLIQKVNNENEIIIDISHLPNAFYLINFESKEINQTLKVIKN